MSFCLGDGDFGVADILLDLVLLELERSFHLVFLDESLRGVGLFSAVAKREAESESNGIARILPGEDLSQ